MPSLGAYQLLRAAVGKPTDIAGLNSLAKLPLRVRGFIFDVDGTLIDSVDGHIRSWRDAFARHGLAVHADDVRRFIGASDGRLIHALTGLDPESCTAKAIADSKRSLYRLRQPSVKGFHRARELLLELRRRSMGLAVASSATGETLARMLRIAGCENELTVESCCPGPPKPDPQKIIAAARWLGLEPADCAMVGDSPFDAEAAAAAGAPFIGLRCGGRSDDVLQPAAAIFDDPEDFERNLDRLLG